MHHLSLSSPLSADSKRTAKFSLGQIVATPAALSLLAAHDVAALDLLARHISGDWGDVPAEDSESNNVALNTDGRLLSSYRIAPNTTIWIITEWDRSATTILRPDDY